MRLLVRLARRPLWIVGLFAHAVGTGLHAVALRFGALSLVQPLLVISLVFALPLRARGARPGHLDGAATVSPSVSR